MCLMVDRRKRHREKDSERGNEGFLVEKAVEQEEKDERIKK